MAGPAEAFRGYLSPRHDSQGMLLHCPARRAPRQSRPTEASVGIPESPGHAAGLRDPLRNLSLRRQASSAGRAGAGVATYVLVRDSEEKGSDVNLATRLLVDGFSGEYEQAVIVSNDADFATAMRYVRDDLSLRVTLVNPDAGNPSPRDLSNSATYVRRLWRSHLRRSQFPDTLTDGVGAITKPTGW